MELLSTTEATRALIDFYQTSHYCYRAREKVEQISRNVSVESNFSLLYCPLGIS